VLRAFGVSCEEHPDGLDIAGRSGPLEAADIDSRGDHRIAMTAAVLGLLASAPSRVRNADCIATSYPKFVATLRALGASIEVVG
jgi:3-phosphoshikimate 1-carboxyvinyltransferase